MMAMGGWIGTSALLGCVGLLAITGVALPQVLASKQAARSAAGGRVAHVLVALADNRYQGIVPVPAAIGNGDDPTRNLYWGAGYGLRTFLQKSADWERIGPCLPGKGPVLERCVFRHRHEKVYVVADAYRGREIKRAVSDFFAFAAGRAPEEVPIGDAEFVRAAGASDLVAYVGHDGLMDFGLDHYEYSADNKRRDAVMLACASKNYFANALRWTGAKPLVWTTGLMAPEAYVIEAVLSGWAVNDTDDQIRRRAAQAYDKYQHCGAKGAMHLFATGW
jgi:hypothetical protein